MIAAAIGLLLVLLFAAVVAQSRPARLALGSIALDEGYDVVLDEFGWQRSPLHHAGPDTEWQPLFSPMGRGWRIGRPILFPQVTPVARAYLGRGG